MTINKFLNPGDEAIEINGSPSTNYSKQWVVRRIRWIGSDVQAFIREEKDTSRCLLSLSSSSSSSSSVLDLLARRSLPARRPTATQLHQNPIRSDHPHRREQNRGRPRGRVYMTGSKDAATGGGGVKGRLFTVGLVTAWYSSNIGVLLLNKYLLSNYGFKYPIFLTMCHMSACSLFSYATIAWLRVVPMQLPRSRLQLAKIAALSLVFCASVVSGNISLRYLPVSFNQAVGATTPFFTAVFAYLMTVKRESLLTYLALLPVVTGVIIASGGEPSFHLFGFITCVGATAARALKTVLQGILMSSDGEKINSMNLLMYMAPIAVILLLPATIFMEGNVVAVTMELAKEGREHNMVPSLQLFVGLLREPDQLPGDEAHKCINPTGPGQRKGCRCSGHLHPDIQEPGVYNWDAGLHAHRHWGASLQ